MRFGLASHVFNCLMVEEAHANIDWLNILGIVSPRVTTAAGQNGGALSSFIFDMVAGK